MHVLLEEDQEDLQNIEGVWVGRVESQEGLQVLPRASEDCTSWVISRGEVAHEGS